MKVVRLVEQYRRQSDAATAPPSPPTATLSTFQDVWLILAVRSDQSHSEIVPPRMRMHNMPSGFWCASLLEAIARPRHPAVQGQRSLPHLLTMAQRP